MHYSNFLLNTIIHAHAYCALLDTHHAHTGRTTSYTSASLKFVIFLQYPPRGFPPKRISPEGFQFVRNPLPPLALSSQRLTYYYRHILLLEFYNSKRQSAASTSSWIHENGFCFKKTLHSDWCNFRFVLVVELRSSFVRYGREARGVHTSKCLFEFWTNIQHKAEHKTTLHGLPTCSLYLFLIVMLIFLVPSDAFS